MAEMNYVCMYLDYLDSFSPYSDAARGKLMMAMLSYAASGVVPFFPGPERYLWPTLRNQIDRDLNRYQDRCALNQINGSKGGRPRKNQTVFEKPNEKEKEKEKENKKENEKERENTFQAEAPTPGFFPPTEQQLEAYCSQEGLSLDPRAFLDHYESNGWMVGNTPMQDWQAAVRNWARKEKQYGQTGIGQTDGCCGVVL